MSDPYTPTPKDLEIAPKAKGPVGTGEHTVELGDAVENLAHAAGLPRKVLWDDPGNQSLREARPNPSTLLPGDRIELPELRLKEESCASEQKHRFRQKETVATLEIRFLDEDGKARSSLDYVLRFGRNDVRKGKTDGDGKLKEKVAPDAQDAVLEFPSVKEKHTLQLRCLGPLAEPVGIQGRLRNLGFDVGQIDGRLGSLSQLAIARFQIAQKAKATSKADEDTLAKLKTAYGI